MAELRRFRKWQRIELPARDPAHDGVAIVVLHRWAQHQKLVKDRSQRVHVRPGIEGLDFAARLLRAHVFRRAENRADHRDARGSRLGADKRMAGLVRSGACHVWAAEHFRESPIHHEHFAEIPDHNVLRLEIAMDHAIAVREGDGVADLLKNGEQNAQRVSFDRGLGPLSHKVQRFLQGDPAHEFHRVIELAVLTDTQFMDRNDIGVLELAGDSRLCDETHEIIGAVPIAHHFHRHLALDARLVSVEDRAHAPQRNRPGRNASGKM